MTTETSSRQAVCLMYAFVIKLVVQALAKEVKND